MPKATMIEASNGRISKDRLLKGLTLELYAGSVASPSVGSTAINLDLSEGLSQRVVQTGYGSAGSPTLDATVKLSTGHGNSLEVTATMVPDKATTISFTPEQLLALIPDLQITIDGKVRSSISSTGDEPFDTSTYLVTK